MHTSIRHHGLFDADNADQNSIDTIFSAPFFGDIADPGANLTVTRSAGLSGAASNVVSTSLASDVIAMSVVINSTIGQGAPLEGTQSFSQFIGFGDSTIDSGYFFTHTISNDPTREAQYQAAVAAGGGLPTSLGGAMNSTLLAQDFGLTAIPIGEVGGTNYAASGATVTGNGVNAFAPSIVSQIQTYLAAVNNQADPNALYLLAGGGNDVKVAQTLSGAAAQDAYMIQQANTFAQAIEQLHAAGAQNIVIFKQGAPGLSDIFGNTLQSDLAAAGVPFISAGNVAARLVDANPAAYGVTNTTQPPSGPFTASNPYSPANGGADINPNPSLISNSWALYATQLVTPDAGQTYLWADDQHLSAVGQQIDANSNYNLIQNDVPMVGEPLTAIANVDGNSSGQFAYQWQSLAAGQSNWTDIGGATGRTFVVQQADVGLQLRVIATYTDTTGSSTEVSPATLPVVPHPSPTVSSIVAASDTGTAYASTGHVVTITLNLTEAVTVTGLPTLQLNDNEVAAFAGGSRTTALTFSYTVQSNDKTPDLQVTGLNLPSGASITDQGGQGLPASVSGDLAIAVNTATVQQEINGLYVTLYGIAATHAGISYWENVLQNVDQSITAANAAVTAISVGDETYLGQQMTAGSPVVNGTTYFATLYPASMSDIAFVQALYQNMSNFIGTVAGDNYWLNLLLQAEANNGNNVIAAREAIVGQFVHDFMSNNLTVGAVALGVSASDYALLVAGQQTLLNKSSVSQYYADQTMASGGSIINYTAVTDPAFTAAHTVLASITNDPSTVSVAITGINNAIAHQDLSLI